MKPKPPDPMQTETKAKRAPRRDAAKPGAEAHTALELATLAARFLPPIDLPDNWPAEHPETLRKEVQKPTVTPYPETGYMPPESWRTTWEVLCGEAVSRARTLLDAAAGEVRPAVTAWEAERAKSEAQFRKQQREDERLMQEFDRLAKDIPVPPMPDLPPDLEPSRAVIEKSLRDSRTLPLIRVLRYALPNSRRDELRLRYYQNYMDEWREEYNAARSEWPEEQLSRKECTCDDPVTRHGFAGLVQEFTKAWKARGGAWGKKVCREAGAKGGRASADASSESDSESVKVQPFTAKETRQLRLKGNQLPEAPQEHD